MERNIIVPRDTNAGFFCPCFFIGKNLNAKTARLNCHLLSHLLRSIELFLDDAASALGPTGLVSSIIGVRLCLPPTRGTVLSPLRGADCWGRPESYLDRISFHYSTTATGS